MADSFINVNINEDRKIGRSISLYRTDVRELLTCNAIFNLTEIEDHVGTVAHLCDNVRLY